jgi:hypothetical protein
MEFTTSTRQSPRGISVHDTSTGPLLVSPGSDPLTCPQCGTANQPTIGPGSGQHCASARCQHARLQAKAQRPSTQAQLAYLAALRDADPPPATLAEALTRIDALLPGEVGP